MNNVTISDSVTLFTVAGAGISIYIETVVQLNPGDDLQVVIANNSTTDNIIVDSAKWSLRRML